MRKVRALTAVALASASLMLGGFAATPASASSGACVNWQDSNTFGTNCGTAVGGIAFRAVAICNNGTIVYGPWLATGSDSWSYAYCTSVNSSLSWGYPAVHT